MFWIFLFATGCATTGVGPAHDWISSTEIDGQLRPEISQPTGVRRAASRKLRVVTFNVHFAADVEGIAKAFRDDPELAEADIAFLQEIQSYPGEGSSRASRLADALGMGYVYAPARTYKNDTHGVGTHGLAILSRYKLENIKVMELPKADLVVDTERRIALSADALVGNTRLQLITVHLDTRINAADRIQQLRPAVLNTRSPVIVGGDFNSNPVTWAFHLVPIALNRTDQAPKIDDYMSALGYSTPTSSSGPTVGFPMVNPRLDSIYSRGVTDLRNAAVERTISVSDHWPVRLDVSLQ